MKHFRFIPDSRSFKKLPNYGSTGAPVNPTEIVIVNTTPDYNNNFALPIRLYERVETYELPICITECGGELIVTSMIDGNDMEYAFDGAQVMYINQLVSIVLAAITQHFIAEGWKRSGFSVTNADITLLPPHEHTKELQRNECREIQIIFGRA